MNMAEEEVNIRSGQREDTVAILELWQLSDVVPTMTDNSNSIACLLKKDKDSLLVAEVSGRIVATVIAAWDGWRGNLYRLAVAPGERRRGIGAKLVTEAERRLLEQGAVRLSILVEHAGSASQFWLSMGYAEDIRVARFAKTLTRS